MQSAQISPIITKPIRYKSYTRILLIVINLCLSNFYFGYVLSYINTIPLTRIMQIFNITMSVQTARGILNGCIPVGAGIGALMAKWITHWFSRRNFIFFANFIAIIAGALIFITNFGVFVVMRLIQGFCIGLYTSTISVHISEISPVEISGSVGCFTQIFISLGVATAFLFYYILLIAVPPSGVDNIWYYVFGFPMVTLTLQSLILIFVFPYETPKYYLMHHDKIKAKQLISILYKEQFVDEVLNQKIKDLQQVTIKEAVNKQSIAVKEESYNRIKDQLDPLVGTIAKIKSKTSVKDLKDGRQQTEPTTPPLAVFSAFHLHILRQFVGINAVIAYGGQVISKSNSSLTTIIPFILNFQAMFGAFLSIFILARVGRKIMIQIGTFSLSVALLFITVGFFIQDQSPGSSNGLILTGLFSYMFIYGISLGTIVWLYLAEVVEPSIISYATLVTWLGAAVVMVLFPIINSYLPEQNPSYLFLFFLLWTSISFVVNHFVLIETKGKTEYQIHQQYINRNLKHVCGCDKVKVNASFSIKQADQTIKNINDQNA